MNKKSQWKPTIKVFLDIRGFSGKPSTITEMLGIEPDEAWSKGDFIIEKPLGHTIYKGPKPRRRKYSCWTIKASLRKYSYNIEDYIKNIINRIAPVSNKLKKLPKGVNLMLSIWIDIYSLEESTPSVVLSVETTRFLSDIKAKVDIDFSLMIDHAHVN